MDKAGDQAASGLNEDKADQAASGLIEDKADGNQAASGLSEDKADGDQAASGLSEANADGDQAASGLSEEEKEKIRKISAGCQGVELNKQPEGEPVPIAQQLCVPGGRFSEERFAVDVFRYLFTLTKVNPRFLPETELEANDYVYGEDTITYLCYPVLLHIIGRRELLFFMCLQGDSIEFSVDASILYGAVYLRVVMSQMKTLFLERDISLQKQFHLSLALAKEMAHFMATYKRGCLSELSELMAKFPIMWLRYFNDNLRAHCEKHKVLENTIVRAKVPVFSEPLLEKFYDVHGSPYTSEPLIETFMGFLISEKYAEGELVPYLKVAEEQPAEDDAELSTIEDIYNRLGFVPHEVLEEHLNREPIPKNSPRKSPKKAAAVAAATAAASYEPPEPTNKEKLQEKLKSMRAIRTGQERRVVPDRPRPNPVKRRQRTLTRLEAQLMTLFIGEVEGNYDSHLLTSTLADPESTAAQGAIPKKK